MTDQSLQKTHTPDGRPLLIIKQQAGWDPKTERWCTQDGRFSTEAKVIGENVQRDEDYGGFVQGKGVFPAPLSSKFEIVDGTAAGEDGNAPFSGLHNLLTAAIEGVGEEEERHPDYMPAQVSTRMRLAEHFYMTEGDATEVCSAPADLLVNDIVVDCPDIGLRHDLEKQIVRLNLVQVVAELLNSLRVYGQAYPLEVWGKKRPLAIVPLPPLHVHRGYDNGHRLSPQMMNQKEWSPKLLKSRFPGQAYKAISHHWNDIDTDAPAGGIRLSYKVMRPIRDRAFSWQRYAFPLLGRGFRDLTSRIVHEDAVRAVTEGYKYQFWVIKVGSKDLPPMPGEITRLKTVLGGVAGERTPMLIWRNGLEVEVHVPKGLDSLIGSDYLGMLTRNFFRKVGITPRVISGETPGVLGTSTSGGVSGDVAELDVRLYMQKVRNQAQLGVLAWLKYYLTKWVRKTSVTGVKHMSRTKFRFPVSDVELSQMIQDIFAPMYETGALSWTTFVNRAGLDPDIEEKNKQSEADLREEGSLDPPLGFTQSVVNPDDSSTETSQTMPKGSPDKTGETRNRMKKGAPSEEVPEEVSD